MELFNVTRDFPGLSSNCSGDIEHASFCYRRHILGNIFGSVVTILIAIISITGNMAVVIVSFWSEILRVQTGNLLVVYLSTVDILTAMLLMIPSAIAVASDYWPLGSTTCKIQAVLNYTFACSSSCNLAFISIDRAVAVLYPFKYRVMMTHKVMIMFCAIIFVISLNIGIACGYPAWTGYNYDEGVCAMEYYSSNRGVFYAFNSGCFLCYYVPTAIIGICNINIIVTANRSGKSVQSLFIRRDNKANNTLKETLQNESHMKKTIKSMIVVIATYYICYTPYALSKQLKVGLGIDMPSWFNYLSTVFIFIASATNPFIYAILRKDYRESFKRLPKMLSENFFR